MTVGSTAVLGLEEVNFTGYEAAMHDITTHDSTGNSKEFLAGLVDGGDVEINGAYITSDAGQIKLKTLGGAAQAIVITFSDTKTVSFQGITKSFSTPNPLDDVKKFSATIKVTGAVTWGT